MTKSTEKKQDLVETIIYGFELLRSIPRTGVTSASQVKEHLENAGYQKSLRSVQRQMDTLSKHFNIERNETSKPYGYRWSADSKGLSIPMLTEQESVMLALAEQYLRNLLPKQTIKTMEGYFNQARYNLIYNDKNRKASEWLSKVRVVNTTQPLLPPEIKEGVFEEVTNALYGDKWLEVDYINSKERQLQATVMPLGLAQQGERLYLVCRFKDYQDERSLALHRINKARAQTLSFDRPDDFDLEQYDNDGRFGFGSGQKIELTFTITKEAGYHLLESKLASDQTHTENEIGYTISATVTDSAMLDWWLRGFGENVSSIQKKKL